MNAETNLLYTDDVKLLVDKPPAKFYQDYYTCYPDTLSTVQAAVGVAAGNMYVTVPIVLAILLPLAFLVLQWLVDKVPLKDAYSKEDEAAALQVVAGMMLRLRDRPAPGRLPGGLVLGARGVCPDQSLPRADAPPHRRAEGE